MHQGKRAHEGGVPRPLKCQRDTGNNDDNRRGGPDHAAAGQEGGTDTPAAEEEIHGEMTRLECAPNATAIVAVIALKHI